MTSSKLLGDAPILTFNLHQRGDFFFIAAFKKIGELPKLIEAYGLTEAYPFIICPKGVKPEIDVPYFAPDIEIDDDYPEWTLGSVRYYRCFARRSLVKASPENIADYLSNPPIGNVVRKFRLLQGGKK